MEQRLANGEFGMPPNVDFQKYNDAWSQLIEQGPKTTYHQVCPLWLKVSSFEMGFRVEGLICTLCALVIGTHEHAGISFANRSPV